MSDARRVVVTGIGLMSALGNSRDAVWTAMLAGQCGIRNATLFETSGYRSQLAAEIGPYCPEPAFSPKAWGRLSRSDQTALLASKEALADSGVLDSALDRNRVGIAFGSGTADLLRNEEWFAEAQDVGIRRARPAKIFRHFPGAPGDVVASHFGLHGPRISVLSACSSSTVAIGYASDAIRWGQSDVMVSGGSDSLCRLTLSGFNALRLVDGEPCRPFCRTRKGMNIGEASAVLVLEEMTRARRRGASIYGEVLGYGVRCEAYHPTAPEPDGHAVAALIEDALRAARVSPGEVDHVNAHGTATPQNDRAEARGLGRVFRERVRQIPVTSIKSMIGHCLAAAGGIEAATLALSLKTGVVPPTLNYREADPDCDLDVVANDAREGRLTCGISTSLAFGGNDAALVMRRVE
jgi:3-oxoacyl-[acyl-carrier-protein] synthase II